MKTWGQLRHAHRSAGAVNALVAPKRFRRDGTFLTDTGSIGVAFRVGGVDVEGLAHAERQHYVRRFQSALNLLDSDFRLYQYVVKTRTAPMVAPLCPSPATRQVEADRAQFLNDPARRMYDVALFMVLVYEGVSPLPSVPLRDAFSETRTVRLLRHQVALGAHRLNAAAQQFSGYLESLTVERLDQAQTFAFLRRLVNYTDRGVRLTRPDRLDFFLSDEDVSQAHEREGFLMVGTTPVRVRTMKDTPSQTSDAMLADLLVLPAEFIACLEWRRKPTEGVRASIHALRRWLNNGKVNPLDYVVRLRPEEMLVDESKVAEIAELGAMLTEMSTEGHYAGECAFTLVLHGGDIDQASAAAGRLMAEHDGSLFEETYNLINAWAAIIPGNRKRNFRLKSLLNTHVADMSFLFRVGQGAVSGFHGRGAVAVLETPHRVPYRVDLWHEGVGHGLVIGPTGKGKSFFLNFLVEHLQQFAPRTTVLFDMGHSYARLCDSLGGSYFRLGLDTGVPINPFAGEPTPAHLHFLHRFATVLMEVPGYTLTAHQARDVYDAIKRVYVLDRIDRRLSTFQQLLPRELKPRLEKWVENGPFGRIFDHVDDAIDLSTFTVFEFERLREYPELLGPAQFYCLNRVRARMDCAPGLTACVIDEAGELMKDPTLRAYVERSLTQWRKQDALMILATQHVEQFTTDTTLRIAIDSCPTKFLLPNASADPQQYAEVFGLNDVETRLVRDAQAQRQVVIKRPQTGARVLTLTVDPASAWRYTNAYHDRSPVATHSTTITAGRSL